MKTITVSNSRQSKKRHSTAGSPMVLKIKTNLCYDNACEVLEEIRRFILQHPKKLVLDFSNVEVMDSSGLRSLLDVCKLCNEAEIELQLTAVSECIYRIINMSGFGDIFGLSKIDMSNHQIPQLSSIDFSGQGWNISEYVATSEPSVIAILRSKVREAALKAGARDEVLCDIQIAAGEALTNAFKHGSPNKGKDKITLRCMYCGKALVVEVEDEGVPFNPDSVAEPDPKLMRENGMGIYIMRQAMDAVEFQNGCPGNKVRLVKWISSLQDLAESKPQNQACQLTLPT